MANDQDEIVAATLTAALIGKLKINDANQGTIEAARIYRILLRKLKRFNEEEAKVQLVADEMVAEEMSPE